MGPNHPIILLNNLTNVGKAGHESRIPSNLFLIQNAQETEQALEELRVSKRAMDQRMRQQRQLLSSNVAGLQAQTEGEMSALAAAQAGGRRGEKAQDAMLRKVHERVVDV